MSSRASVSSKGAVLLGKYVACDAFNEAKPLRIVTHAHHDHIGGLRRSLQRCDAAIMTKATKDLIDVLKGPMLLKWGEVKTLEYGEEFVYNEERLTLHYADHILGGAQVLVEDAEGNRLVYTGDFRLPKTPVIESDVLVVESTYGNPTQLRPFQGETEGALVSLVEKALTRGPVYVFGYHGKLQEVMQILNDAKVEVPFIIPERILQISKVCRRHGMRLGEYLLSTEAEDAMVMLERRVPCIAFHHMCSKRYVGQNAFRISVSGWEFRSPCRRFSESEYLVALSDHSDFEGLLQYVEESNPKLVITDNYRGNAESLAKAIEKRLGIPAKPLP